VTKECRDCAGRAEFYFLKDEVWKQAAGGRAWLCISCLEDRLARRLTKDDFNWAYTAGVYPLNGWTPSAVLWDRLGSGL
jgi:hypothetical protein